MATLYLGDMRLLIPDGLFRVRGPSNTRPPYTPRELRRIRKRLAKRQKRKKD